MLLALLQQDENIWLYRVELETYLQDAEKRENIEDQCFIRAQWATFYNNHNFNDSLIQVAPAFMEFTLQHGDWNAYAHIFNLFIGKLSAQKRYEEAFVEINKVYAVSKEQNNARGEGLALYWMGRINNNLHRFEDAEKNYKEALEVMKDLPNPVARMDVYSSYSLVLRNMKRYDDLLVLLHAFEKEIEKADQEKAAQGIEQRYISPAFKLYNEYVAVYLIFKDLPNARRYYEKMETSPMLKISTHSRTSLLDARMQLLRAEGHFREALALSDTIYQQRKTYEDAGGMTNTLYKRVNIAKDLGDADIMFDAFFELIALNDSIKSVEVNAQLDELRTTYEVDRHILEKERNRNYFIFALAGCGLLAIALTIWIIYSRRLQAKNRALYEQIRARNQYRIAHEETLINRPQEELSAEMRLFRELSLMMKNERLFTDPDVNRRMIAERLATNERYLAEAIHEGAGDTFNNYINQLRLTDSLDLLISQPDLPIDAIATDAGFSSYPTFHRLFTRAYGMGPSEYRRFAKS
ncbi:helix-turn-helix domain-containing protein [Parabacteroides sp. PF5-6]|uniref:AraC family transcriptional regulator n=1 Tax=Parabacteroides sp. PF5-6 TaxID=1742403 RepID=UPI002406B937|nr:helix-turn-helix domain-containing protein [Parabacteroides sp. PF5-6]MDF9830194.1 AraC-like DNA-binding protein [Parabacteroides sp. PF5-6]